MELTVRLDMENMKMPTTKGIVAYAKAGEREKLNALAKHTGVSGSKLILQMIEDKYKAVFGDLPVEELDHDDVT